MTETAMAKANAEVVYPLTFVYPRLFEAIVLFPKSLKRVTSIVERKFTTYSC
jgi:hypothetical protein